MYGFPSTLRVRNCEGRKEGRKKLHPRPAPKAEDGKRTYQDRPKQQHKALTSRCIAMRVVSLSCEHAMSTGSPQPGRSLVLVSTSVAVHGAALQCISPTPPSNFQFFFLAEATAVDVAA
jgi:hypothetical protein